MGIRSKPFAFTLASLIGQILVFRKLPFVASAFQTIYNPPKNIARKQQPTASACSLPPLHASNNNKWERDIDEKSVKRANSNKNDDGGAIVGGAILGGLLGGPFGAVFGATIGANIASSSSVNRARQEEMSRLGIDSDMLAAAQDIAEALERANEGLVAVQDSLDTMQRFAKRLEDDADTLYAKAKTALLANEEEKAKKMLLDRHSTTQKLKDTLKSCVEMKQRLDIMERNVAVLETKAVEIESLLQRTVGAKAIQSAGSMNGLSLQDEDPLLQRFRDLGID